MVIKKLTNMNSGTEIQFIDRKLCDWITSGINWQTGSWFKDWIVVKSLIRRFIFGRLRVYVSPTDFKDLETGLFGDQFYRIIQRMWSFRQYKLYGIPRMYCGIWFSAWRTLGYDYDISNYDFNGYQFPRKWFKSFATGNDVLIIALEIPDWNTSFELLKAVSIQHWRFHILQVYLGSYIMKLVRFNSNILIILTST